MLTRTSPYTILSMIACIALCGCESIKIPDLPPLPLPTTTTTTNPPVQFADAINPAEITWLGTDISAWEIVSGLQVSYTATEIIYDQTLTTTAKVVYDSAGNNFVGNVWIIAKINGKWYAATHEFMRHGYKKRGKNTLNDDHIERREFEGWSPQVGEPLGYVCSTLCRGTLRNGKQRTNIVIKEWE